MPQLVVEPWFLILTFTWLTLTTILQPKILSYTSTNNPTNKDCKITTTNPWTWPWTQHSSINS